MRQIKCNSEEEWLELRRGKITGTMFRDILVKRGNGKKLGFYQLIADSLGLPADGEDPMLRGKRLQEEAIARFTKETGKKVKSELVLWTREDNEKIAISPDGVISASEAVEAKCLGSARHIQALVENKIPDEYELQCYQYFVVNDKLKKLYVVFYDPRVLAKPYFVIELKRKDIQEKVAEYLEYQKNTLFEVDQIILKLSNF